MIVVSQRLILLLLAGMIIPLALAGFAFQKSETAFHKSETAFHNTATFSSNQLLNRASNVESWCSGINANRDYNRNFQTGSSKRTQAEIRILQRDIAKHHNKGLTLNQLHFLNEYFSSIAALSRTVPDIYKLHPFVQKDLNCKHLIKDTLESPKKLHGRAITPTNAPVTWRIAAELGLVKSAKH